MCASVAVGQSLKSGVCGSEALHPVFYQVLPRGICVCGDCTLWTATQVGFEGAVSSPPHQLSVGLELLALGQYDVWMKNGILCSFILFYCLIDCWLHYVRQLMRGQTHEEGSFCLNLFPHLLPPYLWKSFCSANTTEFPRDDRGPRIAKI